MTGHRRGKGAAGRRHGDAGADWWQASDGKWYPPEAHPGGAWWLATGGRWYPPGRGWVVSEGNWHPVLVGAQPLHDAVVDAAESPARRRGNDNNPSAREGGVMDARFSRRLRTGGFAPQFRETPRRARPRGRVGAKARLLLSTIVLISYSCSTEASNNPSTQAEFSKNVQAICRHYNTKGARVAERLVRYTDPAPKTAKIADLAGQELEQLRRVQPLDFEAKAYAEFLAGKELLRNGWLRAADLAQREDNHFVIAVKLDDYRAMSLSAMKIGLDDCAAGIFTRDYRPLESLPAERRRFVEQGDAICRAADEKKAELYVRLEDYFPPRTPAKFAEATAQFAEILRRETDDLRRPVPPTEDRTKMARTLDDYGSLATPLQLAQRAAEKGDADTYYKLWDEVKSNMNRYDHMLRTYGFQQCGWLRSVTI